MKQTFFPRSLAAAIATVLLAASHASPSSADIMIVSSTAPGLKSGMQMPDGAQLDVPAGAKVRVLLPSGATLSLTGPLSRPVKEVTKGEPMVESVWAKARELLQTGGIDQSRPGATRGFSAAKPVEPKGWNVIPSASNGAVCVERGAALVFAVPGRPATREFTLVDTATNAKAQVVWPEGVTQAEWPQALTPKTETVYQIVAAGQPTRQVQLRLFEKAELDETNALRTLLRSDCRQQARTWLQ